MSGRSFTLVLFLLVVGLAVFQLVTSAVQDPAGVLQNILTIGIVLGAFYLLYKLFTRSGGSNTRASYNRAAKQSKRKYAKPNVTPLSNKKHLQDAKGKKGRSSLFKKKRKQSHLTVIEGKKGKKKDRASF
ncbi:SA1362 family protein [Ectobacillus panaciterrae]|uniref:SA1362 family protein n=1 Tax=Ectobacillus panaciterrae TaxID=363872 RepID=UPI00040AB505|nr:SA1362 family protein [Ectobacillus panaciterrae]